MLSFEKPPPDPPCPCEISQLKTGSSSNSDERASDEESLQKVDLLTSTDIDDQNALPKFSIRDYVFNARNKDIKTNWPFSQKILQLCLKHGVKDLLPPFQSVDSVRNQSLKGCTVETSLTDDNYAGQINQFVSLHSDNAGFNQNLAVDAVSTDLSGAEGDKKVKLLVKDQSYSEIGVVPKSNIPFGAGETNTSPEASAAKLNIRGLPVNHKSKDASQAPVKKCRLIVKVGNRVDTCPKEDTKANCTTFPEPMASKVCPVCKTFSSSSNTTLNAHIDQCLSVESTMNWAANSRVIKHRIKPRKTRSMLDIYETAPRCTLEELDRRNGRNCVLNSSMHAQEAVGCAEDEKRRALPHNFKHDGDEGAVYIDANGRKVRILSKFNDTISVPKEVVHGPQKPSSGRGSKLLSTYKKKSEAQKYHKYLKLAPQSKSFCFSKPGHTSEVCGDLRTSFALEESYRKEESLKQPFKAQLRIKHNDLGTVTKWACSKRTALLKRCNLEKGPQPLRYNFRQKLTVGRDQSSLGDPYSGSSCDQRTPNSFEIPASFPEISKRMEKSFLETPISESNQQPAMRKRVGLSSFGSQIEEPIKHNVEPLRKYGASLDGIHKDYAYCTEEYVSSPSKNPVEINTTPIKISSHNPSRSHRAFSSEVPKFSSLRKHKLTGKCSVSKKSEVHSVAEMPSEVQRHDSKEKNTKHKSRNEDVSGNVSLQRHSLLKIRKKRVAFSISQEQAAMRPALESCCHDAGNNIDSSARTGFEVADTFDDPEPGREGFQTQGENVIIGPSPGVIAGGLTTSLSKSLDSEFQNLTSSSDTMSGSLHSFVFKRSLCDVETLSSSPINTCVRDEQEIFWEDEVGNSIIPQSTHMGAELESKDGQGNYFPEVDRITIPGPPGSFLPSPRDMGSEDLQGNSSLTTSRVQSSEDHHDLVDRDSSDSPISSMSTISNSAFARFDSKSSEELSVEPYVTQIDEIRSNVAVSNHDLAAEGTAPIAQVMTVGGERITVDESKVNRVFPEKGLSNFRNDQPCCCSRKDGMSLGFSLNYQESQLLRRRAMASVPLPSKEKQMNRDLDRIPNGLNSVPEVMSLHSVRSSKLEIPVGPVPPITKLAEGSVTDDCVSKSLVHDGCEFAGPSAPSPVLRLMGKNLMVVNRDQNVSQQCQQAQSGNPCDPRIFQCHTFSGVTDNIQKEVHQMVHKNPIISGLSQCDQGFGIKLSNRFGTPSHTPAGISGGELTASLGPQKVQYDLPSDQNRSYTPLAYNTGKFLTPQTHPVKEVIVINDSSQAEADSAVDAPYSEGMRVNEVISSANYNSRHVSPFYSYQPLDSSAYSGSHMIQSTGFQIPPHSRASASPSPLTSSSSGNLRASFLYYSPSFS